MLYVHVTRSSSAWHYEIRATMTEQGSTGSSGPTLLFGFLLHTPLLRILRRFPRNVLNIQHHRRVSVFDVLSNGVSHTCCLSGATENVE